MSYYNPFASSELVYPSAYRAQVDSFCQTGLGPRPSPDDSPFPRVVDLWFMALCIGLGKKQRVKVDAPHKFITGEILARDSWRIELLEYMAIAEQGSGDGVREPTATIALANEYAAAGMPDLIDYLTNGTGQPIWNLTDSLSRETEERQGSS